MIQADFDKVEYAALNESIVRSTVGIATHQNAGIGTGTLVSFCGEHFVLTALHVIDGAKPSETRFFVPPPTSLKEHSMLDGMPKAFDLPTAGDFLLVSDQILCDKANDLAAIPIKSTALIPRYLKFAPIEGS